jgi:hypothetical protein
MSAASPFAYERSAFSIDFFAAREVPVSAAVHHIGEMRSRVLRRGEALQLVPAGTAAWLSRR